MKKFLYVIVIVSFITILLPSVINLLFFTMIAPKTDSITPKENVYEIAVVYKSKDHNASIKQWRTIVSAVNYFTENGLSEQYQFSLFGKRFQLVKYYEDADELLICNGVDDKNVLANTIAILGPITSDCAKSITDNKKGIPTITSFATLPILNPQNRDFFYRTVPSDDLRIAQLLRFWTKNASQNRATNNLIIYDSNKAFSKNSFQKVKDEISKKHPSVHFIDVSNTEPSTYESDSVYESFFVLVNQESVPVADAIKNVKIEQYKNHTQNKPVFYVITELADELLFDTPNSVLAMTPTLVPYNRQNSKTFLSIESEALSQRSASTFLAFEALFRAIERTSYSATKCGELNSVTVLRCGIIENLAKSYLSELIGNIIEFNSNTLDINPTYLVQAEIRTLSTNFGYESISETLPPLVTVDYINGRKARWLGAPVELKFGSTGNSAFKIQFNYRAPDWLPQGFFRENVEKFFTFSKDFLVSDEYFSFHPAFIGSYSIKVGGLGSDFRQSAGRHTIPIYPPVDLFYMIVLSLIIASGATIVAPTRIQKLDKIRLILEVTGAAIFLYLITVTLRGFSLPGAPTLSFSKEPITNLIYCAIIAGTIKLRIFIYFLEPIIARFTPAKSSENAQKREAN